MFPQAASMPFTLARASDSGYVGVKADSCCRVRPRSRSEEPQELASPRLSPRPSMESHRAPMVPHNQISAEWLSAPVLQLPSQLDRCQVSVLGASFSDETIESVTPQEQEHLSVILHADNQHQKQPQLLAPHVKSCPQAGADHQLQASQLLMQQRSQSSSELGQSSTLVDNANCQNVLLSGTDSKAMPTGISAWFDEVADVEGALHVAWKFLGRMLITDLASTLHLVAKLAAASSWGNLKGLAALRSDVRFLGLISCLEVHSSKLECPLDLTRVVWAIGQVRLKNDAVDAILANVMKIMPSRLHLFLLQELSTVLWGLANNFEKGSHIPIRHCSKELALLVIAECTLRRTTCSQQLCINSFWAVAKMELCGDVADTFASSCLEQIHKSMVDGISPQGLASSIWACASLVVELSAQIDREVAMQFCTDAARQAMASEGILKLLSPHELSMLTWGMAKLVGHKEQVHRETSAEVEGFGLAAVKEALSQMQKFRPKALANLAWGFAMLHLAQHEITINFFVAAAIVAEPAMEAFSPQALTNLLWAIGQSKGLRKVGAIVRFSRAAAHQASRRLDDFAWPDLATVVGVFAHLDLAKQSEIQSFTIALVDKATVCCFGANSGVLLSIAKSAALIRVEPEKLKLLVLAISNVLSRRAGRLYDTDIRQQSEEQSHVAPGSQGSSSLSSRSASRTNQTAARTQSSGQSGRMDGCFLGGSFKLV
eukprot:TRINITY_DN16977_c0_g4_i2.p1 TRINITY_DN16977_c0_g4~~TRINITY_DN16977_c0_g4_i2.p1  ORF type:complete len:715 (+),score=125.47 TRINITY_DN16977_c0_g4_i2:1-2145(+)